jgi:hypothetical protein
MAILLMWAVGPVVGQDSDANQSDELQQTDKQKDACGVGLDTFKGRKEAMARQKEGEKFAPKVGEESPDFKLADTDGKNEVVLKQVCKEKPVVLIFGSYT